MVSSNADLDVELSNPENIRDDLDNLSQSKIASSPDQLAELMRSNIPKMRMNSMHQSSIETNTKHHYGDSTARLLAQSSIDTATLQAMFASESVCVTDSQGEVSPSHSSAMMPRFGF